ncbi:hypothetical protein DSO57_1028052 [Entomophthora muscae]|uniref:Uncharacterized protein n=1 Tax=Entomophthora muscae TaxID=34485 RepID=A0ACC2ULX3_9FUNG|nr:hypothetical protein DSO57_1028052 [Entomophthora muscae]
MLVLLKFLIISCYVLANNEKVTFLLADSTLQVEGAQILDAEYSFSLNDINQFPRLVGPKFQLSNQIFMNYQQGPPKSIWVLLEGLKTETKYEARVCFSASTPAIIEFEMWNLSSILKTQAITHAKESYSPELANNAKGFSLALHILIKSEGVSTGLGSLNIGNDFLYNIDLEPVYFSVIPSSAFSLMPMLILMITLGYFLIIFLDQFLNSLPENCKGSHLD